MPEIDVCNAHNCDDHENILKKGMCSKHYYRWYRRAVNDETITPRRNIKQNDMCTDHDCDKTTYAKNMCIAHYRRMMRESKKFQKEQERLKKENTQLKSDEPQLKSCSEETQKEPARMMSWGERIAEKRRTASISDPGPLPL
jgi:hypothetical protein